MMKMTALIRRALMCAAVLGAAASTMPQAVEALPLVAQSPAAGRAVILVKRKCVAWTNEQHPKCVRWVQCATCDR
jgi:hypothetical protein